MATHDYVISNASGAAVRADLNNALAAIVTNNSSATAPTTTYAYQWWADTGSVPAVMKLRNAANSAWITLFQLDGEWTTIALENGTAAAPSLYFLSSGTDTGLYSPGADQVAISTGGTARLYVGSTGSVGIGTTTPNGPFEIASSSVNQLIINDPTSTGNGNKTVYLNAIKSGTGYHNLSINGYEIYLKSGGSEAERARIDSSGKLLVGTSTARSNFNAGADGATTLQVEGTTFPTSTISITRNSNDGGSPALEITKSRGTSVGQNTVIANGDPFGFINFAGTDGTNSVRGASISAWCDAAPGANDMPGRLIFSTTADGAASPTERVRITNDGILFSTSTSTCFTGSTTQVAGTSYQFLLGKHSGTAGTFNSGTISIYIHNNGNIQNTNNSYGAISDVKLKENIIDAGSQWNDLKALQVRKYNFKEETGQQTHTQIGLIAQEVELVSPGLVSESPDHDEDGNETGEVTKGINYSVLYMKAVKALQEAMERIETLEAKVAALEAA